MSTTNALGFGPAFRRAIGERDFGLAVTGAGSWLGQALLGALVEADLLPRRLRLFARHPRRLQLGARECEVEALSRAPPLKGNSWMLLHFAFLGKEWAARIDIATFLKQNDEILRYVLRIAEPASDLSFTFTSSGAVYGHDRRLLTGPDQSPYGWCKLLHEELLASWCRARGVPFVMPRIFNIGGPFVNKRETYALSSMLLAAKQEGVIRIVARRPVFRSFIHVNELISLLCELPLVEPDGRFLCFDTAGRETVEMSDLAALVAAACAPKLVRIERDGIPSGSPDWYIGDGRTYRSLLAGFGREIVGLDKIIKDTSRFLGTETSPKSAECYTN